MMLMERMLIPDPDQVQRDWKAKQSNGEDLPFPFWTRVWPASKVLAAWLLQHPRLYKGKNVLELGAGLALPGFSIAPEVNQLIVSDYVPEAVDWMRKNIEWLQIPNTTAIELNWHQLPENLEADLLLLSDVNYDPKEFPYLRQLITRYLEKGSTVVLATPHRIIAGVFAEYMRGLEGEEWSEDEVTVWEVGIKK